MTETIFLTIILIYFIIIGALLGFLFGFIRGTLSAERLEIKLAEVIESDETEEEEVLYNE